MVSICWGAGGFRGSATFDSKLDARGLGQTRVLTECSGRYYQVHGAAAGCGEVMGRIESQFKHNDSFFFLPIL